MTHLQSPRPLTPCLWDVLQDLGSGDLVVIQATCQVDPLMSQQAVNVLSTKIDIVQENYFISFEGKRGLAVTTADATATAAAFAVAFAILVQEGFAAGLSGMMPVCPAVAAMATMRAAAVDCVIALPKQGLQHFVAHFGQELNAALIVLTGDTVCGNIIDYIEFASQNPECVNRWIAWCHQTHSISQYASVQQLAV